MYNPYHPQVRVKAGTTSRVTCPGLAPEDEEYVSRALRPLDNRQRLELLERIHSLLENSYRVVTDDPQPEFTLLNIYVRKCNIDPDLPLIERLTRATGSIMMRALMDAEAVELPEMGELNLVAGLLLEAYNNANNHCFGKPTN